MLKNLHIQWVLTDRHLRLGVIQPGAGKPAKAPAVDGRTNKPGGKKPARKLLKPVKSHSKRAAFLRWYFDSAEPGRSIGACMANFEMSRPNVIAYWTNIHRDHGIGYALANNIITPILPKGVSPDQIYGVK